MRIQAAILAALFLAPSSALAVGGGAGMATIPAGKHTRLYSVPGSARVTVNRFGLDRDLITRGEFLRFVQENAAWRRSRVNSSLGGRGYLASWRSDLNAGTAAELRLPVTSVSWFAATAYCSAQGKRLPSVDEWEYAAAASETRPDAARDPRFIKRLLGLYAARSATAPRSVGTGFRNIYGVRGLHDHVWEWTADFKPLKQHHDHGKHEPNMFCASAAIGAADPSNYPAFMRYAVRAALTKDASLGTMGFRCAADISA